LCTKGLLDQKGQTRSTYYIAGEKFVNNRGTDTLNSRDSSLNSRAAREKSIGSGENSNATGKSGNVKSPLNSRGGSLNSRVADALNGRAIPLPKDLEEKLTKIGKRSKPEAMKELIIELCNLGSMSLQELANILKRKPSSLRSLYVNSLIGEHKLFHTIPEMLNHPDQKYTTVKNK
jgi:ATP-dependent DNA helicase RecG